MFYPFKTPWLIKKMFPSLIWDISTSEKILYLSFDDGPHPEASIFVLDELKKYNAKATFFCIGKNVLLYPSVYRRIIEEGHRVGNHTHHHLNGWKVSNREYFEDIQMAARYIDSNLFRPPYGRITPFQASVLSNYKLSTGHTRIVMWDVLSGDFDMTLTGKECARKVISKSGPGSIIVFHDSEKAFPRLKEALPEVLSYFRQEGYRFELIGGV